MLLMGFKGTVTKTAFSRSFQALKINFKIQGDSRKPRIPTNPVGGCPHTTWTDNIVEWRPTSTRMILLCSWSWLNICSVGYLLARSRKSWNWRDCDSFHGPPTAANSTDSKNNDGINETSFCLEKQKPEHENKTNLFSSHFNICVRLKIMDPELPT